MRNLHKSKNYSKTPISGNVTVLTKHSSILDALCVQCGKDATMVFAQIGKQSDTPKHLCIECYDGRC